MKDKQDKADEKIEEKLHIAIAKVKNKIIGLCLHLKCEVAKKKQNKSRQGVSRIYWQTLVNFCYQSWKKQRQFTSTWSTSRLPIHSKSKCHGRRGGKWFRKPRRLVPQLSNKVTQKESWTQADLKKAQATWLMSECSQRTIPAPGRDNAIFLCTLLKN